MAECSLCREEVAELEKSWKLLEQWEREASPARIKSRLMAAAQHELSGARISWWAALRKSFNFQAVGNYGSIRPDHLILPVSGTC